MSKNIIDLIKITYTDTLQNKDEINKQLEGFMI